MQIRDEIQSKLKALPDQPGIYLMRDRTGKVIYVGKASSLRNRVRSYFRQSTRRRADPRIRGLINSIYDLEIMPLKSETEATLVESQFIKEFKPRYNVLLRDDKRFLLIKVQLSDPFPRFSTCRIKKDDGATYFGPYTSSRATNTALEYMERRFGLRQCRPKIPGPNDYRHCLNDIIRYCSAPCMERISQEEYRENVDEACAFLRGERREHFSDIKEQMEKAAAALDFERASALRDVLNSLHNVVRQKAVGKKSLTMSAQLAEEGINELQRQLHLHALPRIIETFDISNISGTYAVASMVVAVDGLPNRKRYRLFRIKTVEGIDDPGMMREAVLRRYRRLRDEGKKMPDLVVVDGGITQVRAAAAALDSLDLHLPVIGLAKRLEEIYTDQDDRHPVRLDKESQALMVLQRIRDEAHRFALTYHRKLRSQQVRDSMLDDIPQIGAKRKALLLKAFGSVQRLRRASIEEIATIAGIGKNTAGLIYQALHNSRK